MWSIDSQIGNLVHGLLGAFALPAATLILFLLIGWMGFHVYQLFARRSPTKTYLKLWWTGFAWRGAAIVFAILLFTVVGSNSPKIVLDSRPADAYRDASERANEPLPELQASPYGPLTDSERLDQMRELDKETDTRTRRK